MPLVLLAGAAAVIGLAVLMSGSGAPAGVAAKERERKGLMPRRAQGSSGGGRPWPDLFAAPVRALGGIIGGGASPLDAPPAFPTGPQPFDPSAPIPPVPPPSQTSTSPRLGSTPIPSSPSGYTPPPQAGPIAPPPGGPGTTAAAAPPPADVVPQSSVTPGLPPSYYSPIVPVTTSGQPVTGVPNASGGGTLDPGYVAPAGPVSWSDWYLNYLQRPPVVSSGQPAVGVPNPSGGGTLDPGYVDPATVVTPAAPAPAPVIVGGGGPRL